MLTEFISKFNKGVLQYQEQWPSYQMKKAIIMNEYIELERIIANLERVRYKPAALDEVDDYVANYYNSTGINLGIERLDRGLYKIGDLKVFFSLDRQ